jgi:DNA polymerase I-like protein with 3'-5' exonuclease and polymerase domains
LEKDRYKIRLAFVAEPGNSLIVADYGQVQIMKSYSLSNVVASHKKQTIRVKCSIPAGT